MRLLLRSGFDPGPHAAAFEKVRAAIERGDLRSADVKKLTPYPLHRAKLDGANRLLLKFVRGQGETVCLALEVIENHAYDRCRFLRGAPIDESAVDLAPPCETPEAAPVPYLHAERSTFHFLDRPLSFDDAQEAVLRLTPPALVVGSAGGGKTALALVKLRATRGELLYVTQSRFLAETARGLYFSHGYESDEQSVDFLSFDELLASIAMPAGKPVAFRDFALWFSRQKLPAPVARAGAHACFEEFRGVLTSQPSGPLDRDAYRALGVRQSIYAPELRDDVFVLFTRYRGWLIETGAYEPNLVAHADLALSRPRYDFAVVDEAQDLTNVQLSLVMRVLRPPGAFVLSGDANQIVHPNFFSWSSVKSLLFREARAGDVEVLSLNYRNSRKVTAVANALLQIKHARFGSIDRESNGLAQPARESEGSVSVLPATPAVLADLDQKTARSASVAVVVLRDEDKAEAKKHFRTPLVFSVREAKGLEYESVIVFSMISRERDAFGEIASGVGAADLGATELAFRRARDKGDKSLERYKFFVNALYVALTRAIENVYLVEADLEHPLIGLLGVAREIDAARVDAKQSSAEDWQREAGKLEAQGKAEQADAIRETILHQTKVPWEIGDAARFGELAKKALPRGSFHAKAKQQLLDLSAFHGVRPIGEPLVRAIAAARAFEEVAASVRRKHLQSYSGKSTADVLSQTERYGVDLRNPANLTPLMLAALAGHAPLVRALLERGAKRDHVDTFGRMAVHWAVGRAYSDAAFVRGPFAEIYDLVAPSSFDLEIDGRLVKLGREQGEYFVFVAMMASMRGIYGASGRIGGIASRDLTAGCFEQFPVTVVTPQRKKRAYVNAVLARSETSSRYVASRKLWLRERHGEYLPNPRVSMRVGDAFVPLYDLLGVDLFEEHVKLGLRSLRDIERDLARAPAAE